MPKYQQHNYPMDLLTSHLLGINPDDLQNATRHDFLHKAGLGELTEEEILMWLRQDLYYADRYIEFIRTLSEKTTHLPADSRGQELRGRFEALLDFALKNITREIKMMEEMTEPLEETKIAQGSGLAREQYSAVFSRASENNLLYGVTVLWATEHCFLSSWKFVQSTKENNLENRTDIPLLDRLIDNWTNGEFTEFVNEIKDCLETLRSIYDEYGEKNAILVTEEAWTSVVKAEASFWPLMSGSSEGWK